MSKNSWLCICLMLLISPLSGLAASNAAVQEDIEEQEDEAYYQNNRSLKFTQEEDELNDTGYIEDTEEHNTTAPIAPIQAKTNDCKKTSAGEDCEDIEITN